MGKATLARQRAIGLIGQARTDKLYGEGELVVLYAVEYERLKERIAEIERRNKLLREATVGHADDVAAMVLRAAMEGE